MRYVLKQKLLSVSSDYFIKDESGQDVYFVRGRFFSIGAQLRLEDLEQRELALVRQRLFAWVKTYEISRDGVLALVVRKKPFAFIRHRFTIAAPGATGLDAEGDFLDREYTIRRGGQPVATISQRWFTLADTYGIEIADGEDAVLLLAVAVAVEQACREARRR